MEINAKTGLDYANGRISGLFTKILIPTLSGMVFIALITIKDGIFVGNGVGPDGIAAVNIIAPLYMVATGTGLMFGIGASVLAGVTLARNDDRSANAIVSHAFMVCSVLMAILTAFVLIFPVFAARLMGSSDHLLPFAMDYLC